MVHHKYLPACCLWWTEDLLQLLHTLLDTEDQHNPGPRTPLLSEWTLLPANQRSVFIVLTNQRSVWFIDNQSEMCIYLLLTAEWPVAPLSLLDKHLDHHQQHTACCLWSHQIHRPSKYGVKYVFSKISTWEQCCCDTVVTLTDIRDEGCSPPEDSVPQPG